MWIMIEWGLLFLSGVFFTWLLVCALLYRLLKRRHKVILTDLPRYRFVDLKLENRRYFEALIGNKWIEIGRGQELFVSKKDYSVLWPEPFHCMREKNMSFEATFKVSPLLFGGYSKATLVGVREMNNPPLGIK